MRGERPCYFTNLKVGDGVEEIIEFIVNAGRVEGEVVI